MARRRRNSISSPTIYRGAPRSSRSRLRSQTHKGMGRQGSTICPSCATEVNLRKGRDDEPLKDVLRVSRHRYGGGRVSNTRGDIECAGTDQLVAEHDVIPPPTPEPTHEGE